MAPNNDCGEQQCYSRQVPRQNEQQRPQNMPQPKSYVQGDHGYLEQRWQQTNYHDAYRNEQPSQQIPAEPIGQNYQNTPRNEPEQYQRPEPRSREHNNGPMYEPTRGDRSGHTHQNRELRVRFSESRIQNGKAQSHYGPEISYSRENNQADTQALRRWIRNKYYDGTTVDKNYASSDELISAIRCYQDSQHVFDSVILRDVAQSLTGEASVWWRGNQRFMLGK